MTPEMFAEAQLQIAEQGNSEQTTEILQLNATLLSIVTEGTHDIGSVRFTGQIKCSDQVMAENFSGCGISANGPTTPINGHWLGYSRINFYNPSLH